MNEIQTPSNAEMIAHLERLACGELEEHVRGPLMAWLDEDSHRWRLCGLALLEAQALSDALGSSMATELSLESRPVVLTTPSRKRSGRLVHALVSAACLLIAFALGLSVPDISGPAGSAALTGGISEPPDPLDDATKPVLASISVQPGATLGAAGAIKIPVVPRRTAAADASAPLPEIPEYVRNQWERQGFQLTSERRYLFAHLPDGQQIVVPVDQVLVHSVPQKVY